MAYDRNQNWSSCLYHVRTSRSVVEFISDRCIGIVLSEVSSELELPHSALMVSYGVRTFANAVLEACSTDFSTGWKGVSQVFAAWAIAPAIAAGFAIIIFSVTQYGVLRRKNPLRAGFIMVPFYFAITSGVLTMLIVWKGGKCIRVSTPPPFLILPAPSLKLDDWSTGQILGCIFGVAGGVVALYLIFLLPYLYRRLELNDWTLKPYHIILGPLLWRRGEVPPPPDGSNIVIVQDYYRDHDEKPSTTSKLTPSEAVLGNAPVVPDLEKTTTNICPKCHRDLSVTKSVDEDADSSEGDLKASKPRTGPLRHSCPEYGAWYTPRNLFMIGKHYFFRGVNHDVVAEQHNKGTLSGDLKAIHAHTPHFDNKTEHLYSFLQVMTASVASFAHGSNDVSNAIGPLSTIYLIWHTSELSKKAPVPIWVLVFGASAIVIGLWTYGYNIMRNLGNRLTKHSPSRGFSMELGSALTVVLATRLALPISTTQCITGATVGVGLTTGTWRAINWRMVGWIYMGWIITLPITGIISGCLMGIIINAPTWGTGNFT